MPHFGVLLKNAKTEVGTIMWFDLPKNTCFHYTNAWEESEEIIVISDNILPISFIFYEPQKTELQPSLSS
jgi:carotenoid cleavage dioxygenase-like enzyme